MLLLIDAGNTRVKWALVANTAGRRQDLGRWIASGMVEHARVHTLADTWRGQDIERVLISNVAGPAMRATLEQSLPALQPVPLEWFARLISGRSAHRHDLRHGDNGRCGHAGWGFPGWYDLARIGVDGRLACQEHRPATAGG